MKFAHLADCHVGGWRDPKLKELTIKSFEKAFNLALENHVAFILISGDLFDTSLPSIDLIKEVASILKKAKEHDVSVYIIPGSHDFSPSGKTMLDVLEKAGLCENVMKYKDGNLKFTEDKTRVKITGIFGKAGGLEKSFYEGLNKTELEKESGFKIFMFHTALEEFKPSNLKKVEAPSFVSLPKNFNYYAGGHVHYIFTKNQEEYGLISYPGPTFPNNFKELEELKQGGFYLVDDNLKIDFIPLKIVDVLSFSFSADEKTAQELEMEITRKLSESDIDDKIITLRVVGTLSSGKPSDIKFKDIFNTFSNAYTFLKNTNKLSTKEFEEIKIEKGSMQNVEETLIEEHLVDEEFNKELIEKLMGSLSQEKNEGEKNIDFEDRLLKDLIKILDLKD